MRAAFTGGAAGILIKLDVRPENFQFASRAVYLLDRAGAGRRRCCVATRAMERSRFGA